MAKREIKDVETTEEGTLVTVRFANGQQLIVETNDLAPDVKRRALNWGIREKLQNAAALSRNVATGKPATISEKIGAVERVYDNLLAGLWSMRGEGEGSILLQALQAAFPGKARDVLKAYVDKLTPKQQSALAATEAVKPHFDRIRSERGAGVDVETMLDEVEAL